MTVKKDWAYESSFNILKPQSIKYSMTNRDLSSYPYLQKWSGNSPYVTRKRQIVKTFAFQYLSNYGYWKLSSKWNEVASSIVSTS